MNNIRYRVGILNDFKNSHAFIDYKKYGVLEILDVSISSSVVEYQKPEDEIVIFLNFNIVDRFKEKTQAINLVKKLLNQAPAEAMRDFNQYGDEILKAI